MASRSHETFNAIAFSRRSRFIRTYLNQPPHAAQRVRPGTVTTSHLFERGIARKLWPNTYSVGSRLWQTRAPLKASGATRGRGHAMLKRARRN